MRTIRNIVFTGKLEETRKELELELKNYNVTLQKSVNYDTDIVVVGVRGQHFIDGGYGSKSAKEKAAFNKGIKIIHVNTIEDMLEYFI